jgi:hypothetical protein
MSRFIQALEQRTFLSVSSTTLSTDLATVRTDASAVRTSAANSHHALAADLKALSSDVRALKVTSNNKLMAQLNLHAAINGAKASIAESSLLATGESLSAVVTAEGKLLLKKPTDTKLIAKLSADTAALNTKVAARVSALQTAKTNQLTVLDTDLNAVAANNPSSTTVRSDVTTAEADASSHLTSYNSAVSAFQAAIVALTTDLNSIG